VKLSHAELKRNVHGMDVLQYDVNVKLSHYRPEQALTAAGV
jgi:hypothetical protein